MNHRHSVAILFTALLAACGRVEPEPTGPALEVSPRALTGFTGPMKAPHQYIGLTLLADGRAFAADVAGVEAYDHATNQWTALAPMITGTTFFHALHQLPDGRVLAAGGAGGSPVYNRTSASLYDPATNTWSLTGSLTSGRSRALSTLLADGRVLIVGGLGSSGSPLRTAEIYHPTTGTWTPVTASAAYEYSQGTATRLPDNRVLLVGNYGVEVFDPSTGTFTVVGNSTYGRFDHVAALLPTGKVLLTAGYKPTSHLFDPTTLQFSTTGSMATPARWNAAATVLSDGSVLVAGGRDAASKTLDSVERYNPTTGTWTSEAPLAQKREYAKMVQLSTGEVLVAGGLYSLEDNSATTPPPSRGAELLPGGPCTPMTCAAQNKNCGSTTDGCGGALNCGTCGAGQTCSASNVCVCAPTTCAAQGKTCGSLSNGCGGTLNCGTCGAGQDCQAGTCVQSPGQAQYDTTLRAPACTGSVSSCDSHTLLVGRAQLGPEPQAPNTLGSSCADGTSGTFHGDESLDRLRVTTLDGTPFAVGKTVRVEATVWAYSSYTSDSLDLYSAADASNPSWTFLGTLAPTGGGTQVLSKTYVLPSGARQALRGVFRYGGSASPCGGGSYDDRDDLVFPVAAAATDTTTPTVSLTAPASGTTVGGSVTLQASASDDVGVTRVDFYVQASTPGATPTLLGSDTTAPYSWVWNTLTATPASAHLLTARAYDAAGHEGISAARSVVVDNTPPEVSLSAPAPGASVSGTVVIRVNAVDPSGIDRVSVYIDGDLLGTSPGTTSSTYTVNWNTASASLGTYAVKATAWDKLGNPATTATVSVTVIDPGILQATFSSTWLAPACETVGTSCHSGNLLVGRAGVGPEANAPNTLGGTCADGTAGVFHSDESLERLRVSSVDGGPLRGGAQVRVTATLWVYSPADVLDVYASPTAASPVWTFVGSVTPAASGEQTATVSYALPTGSTTQAVRGVLRYGGPRGPCASGPFDDNDDLVFAVQ